MQIDFLHKFPKKKNLKNIGLHENRFQWERNCSMQNGQMDGQTDMTKLIGAFRNFANAPRNGCPCVNVT